MTEVKKQPSGVAAAMKHFGKRTMPDGKPQGLAAFKAEWDELSPESKAQVLGGLNDGTLNYS